MADHRYPCDDVETSYCMNGGTCYKILSMDMDTLTCVCSDSYKGSRCEQFQFMPSSAEHNTKEQGLIAAVVIIVLLVIVALALVIYYTCKKMRTKPKNQPSTEYWRVTPRV